MPTFAMLQMQLSAEPDMGQKFREKWEEFRQLYSQHIIVDEVNNTVL